MAVCQTHYAAAFFLIQPDLVNWLTLHSVLTHKKNELGLVQNTKVVEGKEIYLMVQIVSHLDIG